VVPDVRFLVVVLVFFVVDFAGVLLLVFAELDLPAVLAGALLVVRDDLLVARGAVLAPADADLLADDGVAIASMRVGGLLGIVARTSLTASVCCSRVMRNSWWPSRVATKYRYGTFAGLAAAARLATPGEATGPGGRPLCT